MGIFISLLVHWFHIICLLILPELGCASDSVLSHLDFNFKFSSNPCDSCHLAKQHRLLFHKSLVVAPCTFHLLHVDLWGPYKTPNLNGANYFLTIFDDYTRVTWTILMKDKSYVLQALQNFILMIRNQFNTTIKILQTDNGIEFLNQQC